jgi:hypothetical protein
VDSGSAQDIISPRGARTLVSLQHLSDIATALHSSAMYMEHLTRTQLLAAIGKEVTGKDVAEYVKFHAMKVLVPEVAPAPLAYAVRRSGLHSPEGMFGLELTFPQAQAQTQTQTPVPLHSLTKRISPSGAGAGAGAGVMSFPLDASTQIQFSGEQFVHAYLHHSFSSPHGAGAGAGAGGDQAKVAFTASARQFSSFVLLLGKVASSSSFEPSHALVVRSKDELKVALDLAVIPTQKEFRDAIQSLSRCVCRKEREGTFSWVLKCFLRTPCMCVCLCRNQQAFAAAFRSMQLEGSLFAAVVIQIKPQLEKVRAGSAEDYCCFA